MECAAGMLLLTECVARGHVIRVELMWVLTGAFVDGPVMFALMIADTSGVADNN